MPTYRFGMTVQDRSLDGPKFRDERTQLVQCIVEEWNHGCVHFTPFIITYRLTKMNPNLLDHIHFPYRITDRVSFTNHLQLTTMPLITITVIYLRLH